MVKRRKTTSKKQLLTLVSLIILTIVISFAAVGAVYVAVLIKQLPSPYQFSTRKINQSTKLYDRTGEILLYEIHGEEKRTVVPFEDIPEALKWATLAAEDDDFYNQPAFDLKAILRAFLINLKEGRITQGGSTITQQLAKNIFLTPERTFTRKLKELVLAIQLESQHSKTEIFSFYLNQIPYGSNAYGVEAASLTYFNKSVRDLTLSETVIIASLPKAPSYYSPWGSHKKELIQRQNYVLSRMVDLGFITEAEKEETKDKELTFAPQSIGTIKAPHFSLTVREYLIERYGEDLTISGGLRVITTLDWEMQQAAEQVIAEGAERNEELYGGKNAALVAQDPKTGHILALVGSRDYFDIENEGNFNVAIQGLRQPGSALKPFAYLTAFKKGYPLETVIIDAPTEFVPNNPNCPVLVDFSNEDKKCFHPQNFDRKFRGPVTFKEGLAQSINVPSVKVLYLAGFDDVLSTIHDFGITTLRERGRYGLSLILGGGEVKLIDLVNAYSTLAEEGVRHEQGLILEIRDSRGNVIETYNNESERVAEELPVRLVNQILSDVELRSGLFQNSLSLTLFPEKEVALKTGTTDDYRDAWAIGYTPSLVVGVWAGNNDNSSMHEQGSSILAAVPIWSEFMSQVLENYPSETFERPGSTSLVVKPMLNGQAVYAPVIDNKTLPQIHSLLNYVNKNDPLGPEPDNPEDDPQFYNWESAAIDWAGANISNFYEYNLTIPRETTFDNLYLRPTGIAINNISPTNGGFVNLPLKISADIGATNGLNKIELYFNRRLAGYLNVNGNYYHYQHYITAPLSPQNLIEIKVTDNLGQQTSVSVIVFH
ncbi:MAG: transglycosylase domain-containing protein [Patescibacteria group bacterium]|nr:transglycosylase domain-containing protein [Patescibacteria group bacterium]